MNMEVQIMTVTERIGTNVCALRKFYGETQEELAESIGVTKNAVSNYEKGKREPSKDILNDIANHYGVLVDAIVNENFDSMGKLNINLRTHDKKIGSLFPLITSDKAMANQHFKRAYKNHMELYDSISNGTYLFNLLDVCFDEYEKAYNDEKIKEEVAADFLALKTYLYSSMSVSSILCDNSSAVSNCIKKASAESNLYEFDNHIDEMKSWQDDFQELLEDGEIQQEYLEYIQVLKKSLQWSELGYYYLALYYYYGIVKGNENDLITNNRIGGEMLGALDKIGNPHARIFGRVLNEALYGGK